MPEPNKSSLALIAIGIFKLVKSALLVDLGLALVRWRDQAIGSVASDWIDSLWVGRPYIDGLLAKLSLMSKRTIEEFAAGSFIYSALFLIEGVGLCLRQVHWEPILLACGLDDSDSCRLYQIYGSSRYRTVRQ